MQSLRDKLMKAGLVSEEDARRAEVEKKSVARPPPPPRVREARLPKLPPLAGSREANRQAARAQLEQDRRIREAVLAAQVALEPGGTTFYFVTRKNKLRRLELSPEQAARLEAGELAVVERPDPDKIEHTLVPAAAAEALLALSEKTVRFFNRPGAPVGFAPETADADEGDEAGVTEGDETPPKPEASPDGPFITVRRAPRTTP